MVMAVFEKVMNHGPGHISTEPLPGVVSNAFQPTAIEIVPRAITHDPRQTAVNVPNSSFSSGQDAFLPPELQVTAAVPPPTLQQPMSQGTSSGQDWPAQIEQLRNDIFGIAMNVSALNDRIDRMEQRLPQSGQSGIATLRAEIESWLENHLNAAVEHCMHQIINRTHSSASRPVN